MQTSIPTTPSTVTTKVVVATTVALTFITFWQAAAVVLNDLASTMFYIGGITEQAIGKPAPWMVLGVMLFSYAVRSVYMESCGMFVRGGVYIVVKDSIGPTVAKLSVSSLVVDLSLIHISEPTRQAEISYAVFCLKKKKQNKQQNKKTKK